MITINAKFYFRALPILTIGSFLWTFASFLYAGFFGVPSIKLNLFWTLILIYCSVWVLIIILSLKKFNLITMLFYFFVCWLTGLISALLFLGSREPIGIYTKFLFLTMSFILDLTFSVGLTIGLIFKGKKGLKWYHITVIFCTLTIITEFIQIIFLGIDIIIILISLLILTLIFLSIILNEESFYKKASEHSWMLIVILYYWLLIDICLQILDYLSRILGGTSS